MTQIAYYKAQGGGQNVVTDLEILQLFHTVQCSRQSVCKTSGQSKLAKAASNSHFLAVGESGSPSDTICLGSPRAQTRSRSCQPFRCCTMGECPPLLLSLTVRVSGFPSNTLFLGPSGVFTRSTQPFCGIKPHDRQSDEPTDAGNMDRNSSHLMHSMRPKKLKEGVKWTTTVDMQRRKCWLTSDNSCQEELW